LNFIGLSYESSILASGDYFTPENPSALGLIRSLGENGVIRIGGNTSERTVWGAQELRRFGRRPADHVAEHQHARWRGGSCWIAATNAS
jgi:hypothetical protein